MSINEMINNYYSKLLEYINLIKPNRYSKLKSLSFNNHSLRDLIAKIIENNNTYLLTDDYLFCTAINALYSDNLRRNLYNHLNAFAINDKALMINELAEHFNNLRYDHRLLDFNVLKYRYKLLSDDYQEALNLYRNFVNIIDGVGQYEEWLLFTKIFLTILGITIINQDLDNYANYCHYIIDNYHEILELLKLHGIYKEDKSFNQMDVINYFINRPIEINKIKSIK